MVMYNYSDGFLMLLRMILFLTMQYLIIILEMFHNWVVRQEWI
jgi:hypothetical protein